MTAQIVAIRNQYDGLMRAALAVERLEGHQNRVIGDAFKQRRRARIHGQNGSLETHEAARVEILQICEGRHVTRHDLVTHQLLELRHGDDQ